MKFYNSKKNDVLKKLNVDIDKGLNDKDIKERQEKYGANEFTPKEQESFLDKVIDAIKEPMILILLLASGISALVKEFHDAFGIIGAIAIGIGIGLVTEGKSKKSAEALSKLTSDIEVKVLRNGHITNVHKSELVPGDIVYLETGDMIPADGRLLETVDLKVREDMLTGESDDVTKKADVIIDLEEITVDDKLVKQDPVPAKQINMVFGGTLVAYGRGTMVVTSIGDVTEMGKIAQNLGEESETPLQAKLGNLGGAIAKISSAIAGLLFILITFKTVTNGLLDVDTSGIMPFLDSISPLKTAFTTCIALIVAAVPEGLPTMINMTLAITMQKMSKINALVTKKEACETIGAISVICSDKTGTLTQNRMTVEEEVIYGDFFTENCLINGTADIDFEENGQAKYMGNATECALLLRFKDLDYRKARKEAIVVAQEQFSSATKQMSTTITLNNTDVKLIKGAPEVILEQCNFIATKDGVFEKTNDLTKEVLDGIKIFQDKAMRVLGFAHEIDGKRIFNGFVGIKDPLRPDVKDAVLTAKKAGVQTKMLTGDNINTAVAIGEELGLLDDGMRAVESSYIDTLTDEQLREEIKTIAIVARSKPDTKMRVVTALQENEEVVAVTGDGINDAPALSKADVGIAMGISGTEVSKNSADIILTDDSFSTIVEGMKWGRGIYDNFQRFLQFQLTVNIVAFFMAIATTLLGQEMPFTTVQLLWVNIIMDGPPALALGLEPVRKYVLDRKPIHRKASIVTKSMLVNIVLNALFISGLLLAQSSFNILNVQPEQEGTIMFGLFAFSALFNAFNCREFKLDSIFPNLFSNKLALMIIGVTALAQVIFTQVFQGFFNSVSLDLMTWIKVILTASSIIVVNELVKFVLRLFTKKA